MSAEAKRRGAPKGNQNARKHGFYSRVLDEAERLGPPRRVGVVLLGDVEEHLDLRGRVGPGGLADLAGVQARDADEVLAGELQPAHGDGAAGLAARPVDRHPYLAGLLAQGLSLEDSASLGVYLHGLAGQLVGDELGDTGLLASDLLPALPCAIRLLRNTVRQPEAREWCLTVPDSSATS